MSKDIQALDLTKRPPRSPRVRLGNLAILPRMLDKGRAAIAGTLGDYHYDCPLDGYLKAFLDFNADHLKDEIAMGKGDGELLEWVMAHSATKPSAVEIAAWSDYVTNTPPGDLKMRSFIHKKHEELAPHRTDIRTLFDLLDLDDHVSYGGKA